MNIINQKSYQHDTNKFYIIPTPIGNLEDITYRTVNILKNLDILYCEDTRVTKKLLSHYEINVKLKSYHEFNKEVKSLEIVWDLQNGYNVGLASDAGMPGINDPGFWAIKSVREHDFDVIVLPGAAAFIIGLIQSNFSINEFTYYGFLPKKSSQLLKKVQEIIQSKRTGVCYVGPHDVSKTIDAIYETDKTITISISREISKIFEEIITGNVAAVQEFIKDKKLKGEFVLTIGISKLEEEFILAEIDEVKLLISQGLTVKDAIKDVAKKRNVNKNVIYQKWIKEKDE